MKMGTLARHKWMNGKEFKEYQTKILKKHKQDGIKKKIYRGNATAMLVTVTVTVTVTVRI